MTGRTTPQQRRGSLPRTVLITGGAGFIGFHTALRLAKEKGTDVVVIDNFNSYYDVQLKKDRASKLLQHGEGRSTDTWYCCELSHYFKYYLYRSGCPQDGLVQ